MDDHYGVTPPRARASTRHCVTRCGTLFGIAILAVASCQTFRNEPARPIPSPVADYMEHDACLDRGGRWLMHAHRCVDGEAADRPLLVPREAEPPAEAH